jgi:crotonobetainyl-CoA:carnitine CoA-transferase CaiB-like acyl-CoA transferase
MTLPLEGVRIIAVEQYGAGPFGTQHMADLGAEVIKIENHKDGGDVGRQVGPYYFSPQDSHFFQSFNRNKRSMTLDLKQPEGQAVFHDLIKKADGVIHNLRGDLPKKLGITYEQLKGHNPAIVCAHLTAYGRTGSRAAWPGYDYLVQAEAGYLSVTGEPTGPPTRFGISIVDMITGVTAVFGLVAGILGARQTGRGMDVDVSLFDVALHNLTYLGTWYLNEGFIQGKVPRSGHPSLVPSQLFPTKDSWVLIMCNKEKFWTELVQILGRPEWAKDPEFATFKARLVNRDRVVKMLDDILTTATTKEWLEKLSGRVPISPVFDIGQALENPFVAEQGMILEQDHPQRKKIRTISCPIHVSGGEQLNKICPEMGADTEDVLQSIGYSQERIARLKEDKII